MFLIFPNLFNLKYNSNSKINKNIIGLFHASTKKLPALVSMLKNFQV